MKSIINLMLPILMALLTNLAMSQFVLASDVFTFNDPVTEKRYHALIKELRCPKCQNQNLADSNAQIAKDLRLEVYQMLGEGKADIEITNYMVARYGEFVLYRPRVNHLTYILWFAPALLLFIGVVVVIVIARRNNADKQTPELTQAQQTELNNILNDKD